MREIKFRIFNKHTKQMIYDTGMAMRDMFENGFVTEDEHRYLMQYTGFKDKNGREIYEGDIIMQLSERTYDDFTGVVKFIDGSYVIESADGKTSVYLFDEVAFNVLIGNIYENPELLEGEPNAI